jgi:vacuolar iron transporter family protein
MKSTFKKGIGFGLTSGIITTLGSIIGLNAGTHSKFIIIIGVVIIAISDALSDAFGMHVAEETSKKQSEKDIWESTFSTFLSKSIFAASFIVPLVLFDLSTAILFSLLWGLILIIAVSIYISRKQKISVYKVIFKHILIAVLVILLTHYIGSYLSSLY